MMVRTLNLDSMFVPLGAPEIEYDKFTFPGGERHIKLKQSIKYFDIEKVVITNRIKSTDDLFDIIIAKDALERVGIQNFDLVIPYLPYARQDRVCDFGESFTLKVFANLLNSCNFNKIYSWDVHSNVGPALVNNLLNISNQDYIKTTIKRIKRHTKSNGMITLISPDAGANNKLNHLSLELIRWGYDIELVKCDKTRDLTTGKIIDFNVYADDLTGKCCFIVDDICDGGATFNGLAEKLRELNCENLYLFVTHGIFSKGLETLFTNFDMIFTTNSVRDVQTVDNAKKIEQYKLYI